MELNVSIYDEGWMAFYQGVSAYDNPYSPENFVYDDDPDKDNDNDGEPIAYVGDPIQVEYELQLQNFSYYYNEWIRGHKDASARNFGYDYNEIPPIKGIKV